MVEAREGTESETYAAADDWVAELTPVASAVRDASDEGMATVTPTDWQNCVSRMGRNVSTGPRDLLSETSHNGCG